MVMLSPTSPDYQDKPTLYQSLDLVNAVLVSDPENFDAWFKKGLILKQLPLLDQALQSFNHALNLQPGNQATLIECGNILFDMEQFEFALAHHEFVLQLNANCIPALNSRALCLSRLGRHEEALQTVNQLIRLAPDCAPALLSQGTILHALGRYAEALDTYQHMICINQANATVYGNIANVYLDMVEIDKARENYLKALDLEPENPSVHWNLGLFYLLTGDYPRGWQLYESGKLAPHLPRGKRKPCQQPMWNGEQSLQGKRILLYAEQGLGDTIQFVRYAKRIADLGAQVIIEVPESLVSLISSLGNQFDIISAGTAYEAFDYHCSLMSLPFFLGTALNHIPSGTPYLFAPAEKVHNIQAPDKHPFRVGLAWSGSKTHHNDLHRSIPFKALEPLLSLNASFHCLQKEIREEDSDLLRDSGKLTLYTGKIQDFSDTAAIVATMDIIISVDTSIAHLAGAMNKPVWVLLPNPPDFRWMLEREDSPWYPTARLFRCHSNNWQEVVVRVKQALEALIKNA